MTGELGAGELVRDLYGLRGRLLLIVERTMGIEVEVNDGVESALFAKLDAGTAIGDCRNCERQ